MERTATPLRPFDRVLVVRLGAIGDVLRALPALRQLRAAYPGAHLAWVVEDLSAPLLEGHPDLDQVVTLQRSDLRRAAKNPLALVRLWGEVRDRLRPAGFTVAIDLQSSLKSGLVTLLSGAPRRVGFAPGFCREMSFLCTTEWVGLSSPWLNRVDRNLEMAVALGAQRPPSALTPLPELDGEGAEANALIARLLPPASPLVVFSPGVSRRQSYKMWSPDHYVRLARLIHRAFDLRPVVVWGPGEEALANAIAIGAGESALLAPCTSLRVLAAVLRRAALFVGADTGTMHLAWIVGCPVVALFGPTDPRLNAPRGGGHVVLRAGSGAMESLAAETVFEAVVRVLENRCSSLNQPPMVTSTTLAQRAPDTV